MGSTIGTGRTVSPATTLRCCTACRAIYRADYRCCPTDGSTLVVADSDPLIGTTIAEHYAIDALLGEGAMGRVYRAHHARLRHKHYAIKVLIGDLAASAEMRMRFAQEAESASKLDHPNVVGVSDFGRTDEGLLYLVMELVEGPTLTNLGQLDPPRAIQLARQLCEGLAHAHARGLVHRDFKPDNILVVQIDGFELPRIADFGIAISVSDDSARLTSSGVMCTPAYAAPEQVTGGVVDHRVDLYALGATMYEMLAGKPAFDGDARRVFARKAAGELPPLAELPPRLAAVIARLLARNPDDRFASAQEVIAALDAPAATPARLRGRRWPWYASAVAGGLAVIAAVGFGAGRLDRAGQAEASAVRVSEAKREVAEPMLALAHEPTLHEAARGALDVRGRLVARQVVKPLGSTAKARVAAARPSRGEVIASAPVVTVAAAVAIATDPDPVADPVPAAVIEPAAEPPPPPPPPPSKSTSPTPTPTPTPTRVLTPTPKAHRAHIAELSVEGSLPVSTVRRAVERVWPDLLRCAPVAASVRFTIDDTRRPRDMQVRGGSPCITGALSAIRSEVAPDVGEAEVELRIAVGDP